MKRSIFLLSLLLLAVAGVAQDLDTKPTVAPRQYPILIMDTPQQLFTMRQVNESYLSGFRLLSRFVHENTDNVMFADAILIGLHSLFLLPLTHEEGHRSVLTVLNIGSVSQPYFNRHGAAYVKGVSDQTLKNLRDTDLPSFIRLHTAGLESDYMLARRAEAMTSFGYDNYKTLRIEYLMRKAGILQYYLFGLFGADVELEEEANELERDIVGYDTYGAARHIHRPFLPYYRYTLYTDLSKAEKRFVQRMGLRSLLSLLNPLIIGKERFTINDKLSMNAGFGYSGTPFGDMSDLNMWLVHNKLKIDAYARLYQNRHTFFPAMGAGIYDYPLSEKVSFSLYAHFWQQPKNIDFNTNKAESGGAMDACIKLLIPGQIGRKLAGASLDFGMIYKTKGFLPEEMMMKEYFGLRIGTTLHLNN